MQKVNDLKSQIKELRAEINSKLDNICVQVSISKNKQEEPNNIYGKGYEKATMDGPDVEVRQKGSDHLWFRRYISDNHFLSMSRKFDEVNYEYRVPIKPKENAMQNYDELKNDIRDIRIKIDSKLNELVSKVDSAIYEQKKADEHSESVKDLKNLAGIFENLIEKYYPEYLIGMSGLPMRPGHGANWTLIGGPQIYVKKPTSNIMLTLAIMKATIEFCERIVPESNVVFDVDLIRILVNKK